MLEIWAQLYDITKDNMYLTLIERYDRHRLFDPLLAGEDVLTNMHANTTIPEIIGCAAVYEATKITRYRDIVLAYWKCAVTDRGYFVTGGQTNGEIWTPKHRQASRLGERNQEHCSVYNMIRLANILFTWTGDVSYLDYIEKICTMASLRKPIGRRIFQMVRYLLIHQKVFLHIFFQCALDHARDGLPKHKTSSAVMALSYRQMLPITSICTIKMVQIYMLLNISTPLHTFQLEVQMLL